MGLFRRYVCDSGLLFVALAHVVSLAAHGRQAASPTGHRCFCLDCGACYNKRRRDDGYNSYEGYYFAVPELWRYELGLLELCCRTCITNIRMDKKGKSNR